MEEQRNVTEKWLKGNKFSKKFIDLFSHWTYDELTNITKNLLQFNLNLSDLEMTRLIYNIKKIKKDKEEYFKYLDDFDDDDTFEDNLYISNNPILACNEVLEYISSIDYIKIKKRKKSYNKYISDVVYDIKYDDKYLFHIEQVKFGGGFIITPKKSRQYKPDMYHYLKNENWGFKNIDEEESSRKIYDFKGKTLNEINSIIDFLI